MESATDILARIGTMIERREQENPLVPKALIDNELIRPEDIAYVHSIFMQCFLPLRHHASNRQFWQTDCGNVSMAIRAGILIKPNSPQTFKQCDTPAGPKARIFSTYVDDYAWREKTPHIDMGENLHKAMNQMGVKIGGKNSRELQREVENFAAAEVNLGLWLSDGSVHQEIAKIAKSLFFWIEKNPDQRTIWQPTMTLSHEYYASIATSHHIAPAYWPAIVGLQHNARAMDIHRFLTYRLRNGLKRPLLLSTKALQLMFGRDIKETRHFWPHFLKALKAALQWYPTARVDPLKDRSGIRLYDSPPLIPHHKIGRMSRAVQSLPASLLKTL